MLREGNDWEWEIDKIEMIKVDNYNNFEDFKLLTEVCGILSKMVGIWEKKKKKW